MTQGFYNKFFQSVCKTTYTQAKCISLSFIILQLFIMIFYYIDNLSTSYASVDLIMLGIEQNVSTIALVNIFYFLNLISLFAVFNVMCSLQFTSWYLKFDENKVGPLDDKVAITCHKLYSFGS